MPLRKNAPARFGKPKYMYPIWLLYYWPYTEGGGTTKQGQRWANPARLKSKSGHNFKSKSTLPKKLKSKSTPLKNDQIQIHGFNFKSTNPNLKIDILQKLKPHVKLF